MGRGVKAKMPRKRTRAEKKADWQLFKVLCIAFLFVAYSELVLGLLLCYGILYCICWYGEWVGGSGNTGSSMSSRDRRKILELERSYRRQQEHIEIDDRGNYYTDRPD